MALLLLTLTACHPKEEHQAAPVLVQESKAPGIVTHQLSLSTVKSEPLVALKSFATTPISPKPNSEARTIEVRIKTNTTALGRSEQEHLDDRLFQLLLKHASEPYTLQRSKGRESSDQAWAHLFVDFKRSVQRVKRASKTIPPRNAYQFALKLSLRLPKAWYSNWHQWTFSYYDEQAPEENSKVNSAFWQQLALALPTLALELQSTLTSLPQRLAFEPKTFEPSPQPYLASPQHQYFTQACVLSGSDTQYMLHNLDAPKSRPLPLDIPKPLDLYCTPTAALIATARSQSALDLIYQPKTSTSAWKSTIPFDTNLARSQVAFFVQDAFMCLVQKQSSSDTRAFRIHCVNPKSGLPLWEASAPNTSLRGIALYGQNMIIALEQALFAFSPKGELLYSVRWDKPALKRSEPRYCVSGDILLFAPQDGLFYAYDMNLRQILWEQTTFAGNFLHCLHDEKALMYDAGSRIVALDLRTHTALWSFYAADTPLDALNYEDLLLVLLRGAIFVMNPRNGALEGQLPLALNPTKFIYYNKRLFLDAPTGIFALSRMRAW